MPPAATIIECERVSVPPISCTRAAADVEERDARPARRPRGLPARASAIWPATCAASFAPRFGTPSACPTSRSFVGPAVSSSISGTITTATPALRICSITAGGPALAVPTTTRRPEREDALGRERALVADLRQRRDAPRRVRRARVDADDAVAEPEREHDLGDVAVQRDDPLDAADGDRPAVLVLHARGQHRRGLDRRRALRRRPASVTPVVRRRGGGAGRRAARAGRGPPRGASRPGSEEQRVVRRARSGGRGARRRRRSRPGGRRGGARRRRRRACPRTRRVRVSRPDALVPEEDGERARDRASVGRRPRAPGSRS